MLRDLFSLFPAYAGVILSGENLKLEASAFPRIRGGDPQNTTAPTLVEVLFPAYAGVIPGHPSGRQLQRPFPRIRGGDPQHTPR